MSVDLRKTCGHVCACPSRLHHEVAGLKGWIDAPVYPGPSLVDMSEELARMLQDSQERHDHGDNA